MLSQHERRTLAVIEERLSEENPDLDRMLATFGEQEPVRRRTRHRTAWSALLLGIWLLGWAFAMHNADVLALAVLALLAGAGSWLVVLARAAHRRHAPGGRTAR